MYIYDNISLNSFKMRNISDKTCRGNQNILCPVIFYRKSYPLCDNAEKYDTARLVRDTIE